MDKEGRGWAGTLFFTRRSACRLMPAEAASEMTATTFLPAWNSSRSATLIISSEVPGTPLALRASHWMAPMRATAGTFDHRAR